MNQFGRFAGSSSVALFLVVAGVMSSCQDTSVPEVPELGTVDLSPDLYHLCPAATMTMTCPPQKPPTICPPPARQLQCPAVPAGNRPLRVLLFTRDLVWMHASNCVAAQNLAACAVLRGWTVTTSADPTLFNDRDLSLYDVVVFSMTSGNVFDTVDQQDAFQTYISRGKGFVGIHSASYTQLNWPWFVGLVGATVLNHPPDLLPGSLLVDAPNDPINATLPTPWVRCEELYTFRQNPATVPGLVPLVSLDENCPSYPEDLRLGSHPLSWRQQYGGGRSFYTALGHHPDAYYEQSLLAHILAGVAWAGGG